MLSEQVHACKRCGLRAAGCRLPVAGHGPTRAHAMLVGEAPGKTEDKEGLPFVGPSGCELNKYLADGGLSRDNVYVTNTVKCRPPDDRNPTQEEIDRCVDWLRLEFESIQPRVVGFVGNVAASQFMGSDYTLDKDHGILTEITMFGRRVLAMPIYHPASGMYRTSLMSKVQNDLAAFARAVRGELSPVVASWGEDAAYFDWAETGGSASELAELLDACGVVAVDTETEGSEPWCLSFSTAPDTAWVIKAVDTALVRVVADKLADPLCTTLLHNALFDLRVLAKLSIRPAKIIDTMVAAYLLQDQPQGLKALAYRLCGMRMHNYPDMVRDATQERTLSFLLSVNNTVWTKPEQELYVDEKTAAVRYKRPQGLNQRVKRILTDASNHPDQTDLLDRWYKIDDVCRQPAEDAYGVPRECYLSEIPRAAAIHYAARDADATLQVWQALEPLIRARGLDTALELDIGIIPMIVDMETNGMLVNVEHFRRLTASYTERRKLLEASMEARVGEKVNPASNDQVRYLLFNRLGLNTRKSTRSKKTGELSTDSEVLFKLRGDHPIVDEILSHRKLSKLSGTYSQPLAARGSIGDGRIHPRIRTTATSTGRLSCANPNLQNIPVKDEESLEIRRGFTAAPGCYLLSSDYSQIEMRIAAHISGDRHMIQLFRDGKDIHAQTASAIFGIPVARLDKLKHRYPAKRVGFGVLYGLTPEGLFDQLELAGCVGWNVDKCAGLIKEWFNLYPGVRSLFSRVCAQARRVGYVSTFMGRTRLIPEVRSSVCRIVEAGNRQAENAVIQGGAQDVIKAAMRDMIPIYREFQTYGRVLPLIQIHDDLMWEVEEALLPVFADMLENVMVSAVKLSVPVLVDVKYGTTWADLKSIKEWEGREPVRTI